MPLSYPLGTIDEHLACRHDSVVFDVSHLGTVRVEGSDADERLQFALTNDLYKIGPGPRPVHAPARRASMPRCSTTSSSGGSTTRSSTSCPTHRTPIGCAPRSAAPRPPRSGRARRAGPTGEGAAGDGVPRGCRGRPVPRQRADVGRHRRASSPAPATPARPASRSPFPTRAAADLWTAIADAGVTPAGLGARDTLRLEAGAAAARPRARCRHHLVAGRSRLGRGLVEGRVPRARAARRRADRGCQPPADGASPPTAADHRAPTARVFVDDQPVGIVTSGNFSPVLGHGIALAFMPPGTEVGTEVVVDVRGTGLAGRVVATPFVAKH